MEEKLITIEKTEKGEENHEEKHEPPPNIDNDQKPPEERAEEKSKYQQELDNAKKKSSSFQRKKSMDNIKTTNKVSRSDFLSKLEEADIKDQSNPHNQKYMPFDGFKGPACKFSNEIKTNYRVFS